MDGFSELLPIWIMCVPDFSFGRPVLFRGAGRGRIRPARQQIVDFSFFSNFFVAVLSGGKGGRGKRKKKRKKRGKGEDYGKIMRPNASFFASISSPTPPFRRPRRAQSRSRARRRPPSSCSAPPWSCAAPPPLDFCHFLAPRPPLHGVLRHRSTAQPRLTNRALAIRRAARRRFRAFHVLNEAHHHERAHVATRRAPACRPPRPHARGP